MAAVTQAVNQPILSHYYTLEHPTIAASVAVYGGTLAMAVSGQATPAVGGTAGSTLLGMAYVTTDNRAITAATTPALPMIFLRGTFGEFDMDSTDLPVVGDLGKSVYITDNNTIHHTNNTNDLAVTLVALLPGNRCRVWIP